MEIIDESSALKIYDHYNKTGLRLVADNTISGNFEINNKDNKKHIVISVNLYKNLVPNSEGFTLDNYHDIHNSLNIHEGEGHYKIYKEIGPYKYDEIPRHVREMKAIETQIKDPSWKKTTKLFKVGVIKYYQINKMMND